MGVDVPDTCPVEVDIASIAPGDVIELLPGTRLADRVTDIIPSGWPGVARVYFRCGVIAWLGPLVDRYA
jgi:hypothetical protein